MQQDPYVKFLNSLSKKELIDILISEKQEKVPITIFLNELAPLESIVRYLKDGRGMSIQKISEKLKRSNKTIWATYNNAKKNAKNKRFFSGESQYNIPISFFAKKTSILETAAYYLKENHSLTLHQVAALLQRDDRTIWTLYHRALKKNG